MNWMIVRRRQNYSPFLLFDDLSPAHFLERGRFTSMSREILSEPLR